MNSPFAQETLFTLGTIPVARAVVTTWGLLAGAALFCFLVRRRLTPLPSRTQAALEALVEGVDFQIRDAIEVDPAPYRRLVGGVFLFVLGANWASLIPGVEPPTAKLETDIALALVVLASTVYFGVRANGWRGYLRTFAQPTWLMIPLNLVEQATRSFSLVVRLFGNVMSGVFIVGIVLSIAGLIVPIPLMALDLFTGAVQAYIFATLALVFIGSVLGEAGDHSRKGL